MPKRNSLPSDLASQLGSSMKELQEILALQVHRAMLHKYPDGLWDLRRAGTPYEQLPDEFRAIQRQQALEALQDILGKGFRIQPPASPEVDLTALRSRAERLLAEGEPLQAYDVLQPGLALAPEDPDLRRLKAVALLGSGAPIEAIELLEDLLAKGHRNPVILGVLGRAHRELGGTTPSRNQRLAHYQQALDCYEEILIGGPSPWIGLHAATMALMVWDLDRARRFAAEVTSQCQDVYEELLETGQDAFWVLVVMALASLIQGGWKAARSHIQEVAEHGATRARDLADLRYEARRILAHLGEDPSDLETMIPAPKVVVFAGHMVDHADRRKPRFPPEAETAVASALAKKLGDLDAWSGFASAAAGSPILFHELMQARGAETHVVLPYDRESFLADSVAIRPDGLWIPRFDTVLRESRGVIFASPLRLDEGSIAFRYNHELLLGLGSLRARQLHAELVPLVLWDGETSLASGSVSATHEAWSSLGYDVQVLNLREILDQPPLPAAPPRAPRVEPVLPRGLCSDVMVMLFADVVHFSQLNDAQVPRFVDHFLGALQRLEEALPHESIAKNTWGDGLFYVFKGLGDAASFATSLVDTVRQTPWGTLGLPENLDLRVALHAGPVFVGQDPVTGRPTCFGTHVNRAARIEPITPPGKVYVSQAFAALAMAQNIPGLLCEYVGKLPLAKDFGTFPMYVLRVLD